jgi:hypothetical protein
MRVLFAVMVALASASATSAQGFQPFANAVDLNATLTDVQDRAVGVGFSYLSSLGDSSLFKGTDKSFTDLEYGVAVETGSADAFSTTQLTLGGFTAFFQTTEVAGFVTPEFQKTFHVVSYNAGLETNERFGFVNGLVELGYVPWYWTERVQSIASFPDYFRRHSRFQVQLQAGYKWGVDTGRIMLEGGKVDASSEAEDSFIARGNASFALQDQWRFGQKKAWGIGYEAMAQAWYDIANGALYYQLKAEANLLISSDFSLKLFEYERGAGAPLFNEGDQFSAGLSFTF